MNAYFLRRFSLLFLLCITLFFFGNNLLHLTDPDEVFYSLTAKEMNLRGEWLTPYIFNQPQFEKPILTYWLLKISFMVFGDNAFSARFFPALFATFGVLGIYLLGLVGFINERRAFLAAFIMATAGFYLAMGKTVFTDMIFSVFILYSLISFYTAYIYPNYKKIGIVLFFVFAALATLTKGPLGLLIPLLTVVVFLAYVQGFKFLLTQWFLIGFLFYLGIALPWYWHIFSLYGKSFIQEFFYNDHWRRLIEAEHKTSDRWFFYPLTMVGGLFPWSLFLVAAFVDIFKRLKFGIKNFEYFLLSWVLIVFFIFQIAHSKLSSYILPMFPALALLTANYIDQRIEEFQFSVIKKLSYTVIGFLTVFAIVLLAAYKVYKAYLPSISPVYFLSAALLTICGISLTLFIKEKVRAGIVLLGFCLVPIFMTAFMIASDVEPYVSMYEATNYLPIMKEREEKVLVSKSYARGVRYFTGQDVVAMDINGGNYFSPHPIAIMTSENMLNDFLKSQRETFAIVKKSQYKDLSNNHSNLFQIDVLKVLGTNYVLKIQPKKTA